MLLIHLLHITWQQLHQWWQLELVSGWNSWRDLTSSSAEDERQMPGAAWAPCPLAAAEHCWGAGVTVWSRCCSVLPIVVPWLAVPGDSNEKGRKKGLKRKSSLAQRPKQRGVSALCCLSFSVASGNEREACVNVVLILKGSWHLLPPWTWGKILQICFWLPMS